MHVWAVITKFISVLHACRARHFQGWYRYYMHVVVDIFRVCIGITCMSGQTFSWPYRCGHFRFVSVLHAYIWADIFRLYWYCQHVGPIFSGILFVLFACMRRYFQLCIGIACMSGPTFSESVFVLHECSGLLFKCLYRYYMHVGADIFRICIGITCI